MAGHKTSSHEGSAGRVPATERGSGTRRAVVRTLPIEFADDAALARAVAARHPAAARAVWERFSGLVRGLQRRMMGPALDAEDLVQETFLQFFKDAARLRDPSRLSSFIVGIAMRVARSELRRRRVRRWLHLTETGTAPDVEVLTSPPEVREALQQLYAVLDRVDDRARMVFVLRHVEGYELREVATALGCSLATAKRRLVRGNARVLAMARREPALHEFTQDGAQDGPLDVDLPAGVEDER